MRKVYVDVNADHKADGKIIPVWFVWEDGHKYEIDRVIDIQRAAAMKVGGIGLRYTIMVRGKQSLCGWKTAAVVGLWKACVSKVFWGMKE